MGIMYDSFFPTPQHRYILVGVYTTLCLVYVAFGLHSQSKVRKAILKCAPVLSIVIFLFNTVSTMKFGPTHEGATLQLERVLFGLFFSLLGDLYLVFDTTFILGLISFTVAQMIYIFIFGGWVLTFGQSEIVTAAAILLVSTLIYSYLLPKLKWFLVVPVAIYCLLISVMLWCAIVCLQQNPTASTLQGAVGACLFYTSDLLLGINRYRFETKRGPFFIIVTYYVAQMLITFKVIDEF